MNTDTVVSRPVDTPTVARLKRARANRKRGRFLKGPIPVPVLQELTDTPLKVYLLLRHRRDLVGATAVTVPTPELRAWHLTRQAYYRALDQLEAAGLIVVERRPGRPIRVTLRD